MANNSFAKLLEERNATIASVHRATNVPTSTLSEWKDGKYIPKAHTVLAVAKFFGVTMESLVDETGSE